MISIALEYAVLEKLPILDGVCREALRIHAPISSYLEWDGWYLQLVGCQI